MLNWLSPPPLGCITATQLNRSPLLGCVLGCLECCGRLLVVLLLNHTDRSWCGDFLTKDVNTTVTESKLFPHVEKLATARLISSFRVDELNTAAVVDIKEIGVVVLCSVPLCKQGETCGEDESARDQERSILIVPPCDGFFNCLAREIRLCLELLNRWACSGLIHACCDCIGSMRIGHERSSRHGTGKQLVLDFVLFAHAHPWGLLAEAAAGRQC
mmetsp:Transcript_56979/g.104122  ORF Transcript_56979/g.104122 Transcript_56979/m.104122 type:complete len:215 (-) Transcript_56979:211-855(-)